jgi:enamine deaminase RidA (YjgF/YER057c/UK114 family)
MICPHDPAGQTAYILDKITACLSALGASLEDVVRTRIYLANPDHWEEVARVHGRYFAEIRPANTLIAVSHLIGGYLVEIECEAIIAGASG